MVRADLISPVRLLTRVLRPAAPASHARRLRQAEERSRSLAQAEDQWLSVLREMEHNGEAVGEKYERYHQAHRQIKQQQKAIDLELFNLRHSHFE